MNKTELIKAVTHKLLEERGHRVSQLVVAIILDETLDAITEAIGRGDKVSLRGFGVFSQRRQHSRIGRNPRTGESVSIRERTKLVFKASKPSKTS